MTMVNVDGMGLVGTGLLVPDKRLTGFTGYLEAAPVYSHDDIVDVLRDPNRRAKTEACGPETILNQGSTNSCNGHAASSCQSRSRQFRGHDYIQLSPWFVYAFCCGGRDRGSMLDDGMRVLAERGTPPYEMASTLVLRPNYSDDVMQEALKYRALECYAINTELELFSALALHFQVVVAVHCGRNFNARGPDYKVPPSHGAGNHAVFVTDAVVENGKLWGHMVNSWGMWGNQGVGMINWQDHLASTVRNHYFYAIRSTTDHDDTPIVSAEDNVPVIG